MDKREPFQILLIRNNYADPKLPVHVYAETKITANDLSKKSNDI